jgi:hypothetical protein
MAFVVERADGRYEIRETVRTPKGPRARTLAIFAECSDEVLDHAESRAVGRFDRDAILAKLPLFVIPWKRSDHTVDLARELLADLARGRPLPPAFVGALKQALADRPDEMPDTIPPMLDWVGASAERRAGVSRQLLKMIDGFPRRAADPSLDFPPIDSRGNR